MEELWKRDGSSKAAKYVLRFMPVWGQINSYLNRKNRQRMLKSVVRAMKGEFDT